jgi:RimJ/RimL family protein N-acetyltransferase
MTATQDVQLRPIREDDLELLEQLFSDPGETGEHGFYGYRSPGWARAGYEGRTFLTPEGGRLAVAVGDAFVGEVQWHAVLQGPGSRSWNIGIALLGTARGQGYGSRAQRMLAEYLFSHTQVNRVEAGTETGNVAEQRALEKAGFTREGVQRGSCFRAGVWRDMVVYSMLRQEVELGL